MLTDKSTLILKKALSIAILLLSLTGIKSQDLVINEVCSSNLFVISDEDGDYPDWIELYCSGSEPIHLNAFGLSDDTASPMKWALPDTILQPGEFLLIWASGKDRRLHTNFKLNSTGETLILATSNGEVRYELDLPGLPPDLSFGRYPDGNGDWGIRINPSPSLPNNEDHPNGAAEFPVFSVPEGFYKDSISIFLSTSSSEDSIYFTQDGSVPTRTSHLFGDSIFLDTTATIRARAFISGLEPGAIATRTFFINESSTFSTFSLTTDPNNLYDQDSGIFVFWSPYYESNLFQDWERPVHVQFFDEDQQHGFSMDAGVKVHGGLTRNVYGKSLAIMARASYGQSKINYRVFTDKELEVFNNLVLRNSGNDYKWTMFRDCFMHSIIEDEMDLDLSSSRQTVVFLNGRYWGIRNIREKMNEHFLAGNYSIPPSKIDLLEYKHHNDEVQVVNGSADQFNELIQYIEGHDLAIPESFEYVTSQMDIYNYIKYLVAQIYFDNSDWPGNNIKWWRRSEPAGKWRWLMFDTDFGFSLSPFGNESGIELEHYKHNTLNIALQSDGEEWPNPPHSTFLFRSLLENTSFKHLFVNTFCDHLNTTFQTERILPILSGYKDLYAPEMERHHLDNLTTGDWEADVEVVETFARERIPNMFTHLATRFGVRHGSPISLDVSDPEAGSVGINSIICMEYPWQGTYLSTVPVHIRAIPRPGYEFKGWSDGIDSIARSINVDEISSLTANFELATFDPQDVMISEINYRSSSLFDTEDWIELYNHSDVTGDLSGWVFKDSNDDHAFVIPENTIIEPKSTMVLCREIQNFKLLRSDLKNITGSFGFGLSSNGEAIRLFNTYESMIDHVVYGITDPWPELSDTGGMTLELINPELDNALASSWRSSTYNGGNPGEYKVGQHLSVLSDNSLQLHKLGQNYPNPFSDQTTIYYEIGGETRVNISIYNLAGQLLSTLVERQHSPGSYSCIWDGTNASGMKLRGGVYLYRISTADYQETRRMILLK